MELRRFAVCNDCISIFRSIHETTPLRPAAALQRQRCSRRTFSKQQRIVGDKDARYRPSHTKAYRQPSRPHATTSASQHRAQPSSKDLNTTYARIQELSSSVLNASDTPLPPEQRTLFVLEQLDAIAKSLVNAKSLNGSLSASTASSKPSTSSSFYASSGGATATSALLGSVNNRQTSGSVTKVALLSLISQKAEEILRYPYVFITPSVLQSYIELQTLLHQPSSFPDILALYASKPIPKAKVSASSSASISGVNFVPASPDKINAAVPANIADVALAAAITAHDLPLAIEIIRTTFCTPAFRKAKLLRQAIVPVSGLALAPVAAYTLSTVFASHATLLSPAMATNIAFAGIMTYVAAVSTVGYVAITTSNDQMDRVTWAQGVPLWERWVREEERGAVDRLAQAWGFKERDRRGDEEGEEWESLREWVGRRGMVLDAVGLMDGME